MARRAGPSRSNIMGCMEGTGVDGNHNLVIIMLVPSVLSFPKLCFKSFFASTVPTAPTYFASTAPSNLLPQLCPKNFNFVPS